MFCKDFRKIEFFEKALKNLDFGSVLGGQSDEKSRKHSVAKSDFFEHRFYEKCGFNLGKSLFLRSGASQKRSQLENVKHRKSLQNIGCAHRISILVHQKTTKHRCRI